MKKRDIIKNSVKVLVEDLEKVKKDMEDIKEYDEEFYDKHIWNCDDKEDFCADRISYIAEDVEQFIKFLKKYGAEGKGGE